ncbi:hypothetical protein PVAND_014928 [Polypedilum vanderplanki]|uniref:Zinc finger protein n=1 Tax=Polypedilum vanderplanki TaxID=319348 RepID=A0A9J6BBL0_POLVA|nr:hypothetical protein PVAND_014928 [Polypedilum vanderplanki]
MPSCCIPGCKSSTHRDGEEISLFKFTRIEKRRELWFDFIEKGTGVRFDGSDFSNEKRICNLHFKDEDMTVKYDDSGICKRYLNKDAVPSIFHRKNKIKNLKSASEIQRVCRICLKKLPTTIENFPINEELPSISLTIIDALNDVIGIELRSHNTYPSQVCAMCHSNILTAYNLKYRVIKTEESLKKMTQNYSHSQMITRSKDVETHPYMGLRRPNKKPAAVDTSNVWMNDLLARIKRGKPHTQTKHEENIEVKKEDNFSMVDIKKEPESAFDEQNFEPEVKIEQPEEEEEGEEPTYLFEAFEMDNNQAGGETTFMVEQPASSPEVTFMSDDDEPAVELSSDDEPLVLKKTARKTSQKKYEQWPELLEKKKQKTASKICKKCNYEANTLLELNRHIDHSSHNCLESYEPKLKCYICNRMFMLQIEKLKHIKKDHAKFVVRECDICEKPLRETAMSYENHMRSHFEPPNFLCVLCGKGYYKANHLHKHKRDVHDDNYWHICDICGLKSKAKILLGVHMRKHTKERPVMCDICSKSLFSSICLIKHKFTVHKTTQRRVFRCEKCDYCFLYKTEFERHIISCDGGTRNPKCYARIRYTDLISARKVVSRMN